MLEEIKKSLRIDGDNDFDEELNLLIGAAKEDLISSGVAPSFFYNDNVEIEVENKLLKLAITLFCKAFFGFDNADSEKFNKAYEYLKGKLSINLRGK